MPPHRPRPHLPAPGSVRPQDAPRLLRLRDRLARRWARRRRRQLVYLIVAFGALTVASSMGFNILFAPRRDTMHLAIERIVFATPLVVVLATAVYAIWRFDRTARRMRGSRIRLHQVQRRLASLQHRRNGGSEEHPLA